MLGPMSVDDTELAAPPPIDGSAATKPAAEADTLQQAEPAPPVNTKRDVDEYETGIVLGARYRVVGLIGQGGMGEVYRAHDLVLQEDVAIKFLPRALGESELYLSRFLAEVRLARQVTHPNVCRVHDIGEIDGRRFLSMEHIDGEDLESLLRRIGRLPQEKAVELAHALCHGLHALHERGILHRDLKPSNVMLDGRGRVKLADFGLAAVAEQVGAHEIRDGTPGYMAPEQASGAGVTVRSDVYALGLVLFELFTGKHAHAGSRPTMADHVSDVDAEIQRVIERCLDADPEARPSSALAVAAALPGGDPIAAALAAGETLSPDSLLRAGRSDGLGTVAAAIWLGVVVVTMVLMAWIGPRFTLLGVTAPPHPPEVLVERAREALAAAGHDARAADRHYTLDYDREYSRWSKTPAARDVESPAGASAVVLDYREHPTPMHPSGSSVTMEDPALDVGGAARVRVDARGQLRELTIVPPEQLSAGEGPPDFTSLLQHAGFDPKVLERTEPRLVPPVFADHRVAWTTAFPDDPDVPVRIEAAGAGDRVVSFVVLAPWSSRWDASEKKEPGPSAVSFEFRTLVNVSISVLLLVGSALLAHRALSRRQSDTLGAARIGLFVGGLNFIGSLFVGHLPVGEGWYSALFGATRNGAFFGLLAWLGYVIVEPHARRVWPRTMVSWVRVMRGQFRDRRVAGDVLVGTALGGVFVLLAIAPSVIDGSVADWGHLDALCGPVRILGAWGSVAGASLGLALLLYVWMLLFRLLTRRDWATAAAFIVVRVFLTGVATDFVHPVFVLGEAVLLAFVVMRAGLLAMAVTQFVALVYVSFPSSLDLQPWWAPSGLLVPLVVGALAVLGYRGTTRAGTPSA